jgi:muramoyltetrapeptide carboxypeptidase
MCNSFSDDWNLAEQVQKDTIESIQKSLAGKNIAYPILPNLKNRTGTATGTLVGGNPKNN